MSPAPASYPLIGTLAREGALVIETAPLAESAAAEGCLAARTTVQFDGDVVSIFDQNYGIPARDAHFAAVNKVLEGLETELRRAGRWVRLVAVAVVAGRWLWLASGLAAALAGIVSAAGTAMQVPPEVTNIAVNALLPTGAGLVLGAVAEAAGRLLAGVIRKRLGL